MDVTVLPAIADDPHEPGAGPQPAVENGMERIENAPKAVRSTVSFDDNAI